MVRIRIKRVYQAEDPSDGFRIFVDKLWPRGLRKESFHYDLWAKDLAPSTFLREWFHEDEKGNWEEFREKYMRELSSSPVVRECLEKMKGHKAITLLYASKNAVENHALVLQRYLSEVLR